MFSLFLLLVEMSRGSACWGPRLTPFHQHRPGATQLHRWQLFSLCDSSCGATIFVLIFCLVGRGRLELVIGSLGRLPV